MLTPSLVHRTHHRRRFARPLAAVVALICTALLANLSLLASSAQAATIPAGTTLVPFKQKWSYWRESRAPQITWLTSTTTPSGWLTASAPFGTGTDADIATTLPATTSSSKSSYYRMTYTISDLTTLPDGAQLKVVVDDGAIVYVNGHDVGRRRVDPMGYADFYATYASAGITHADAVAAPVTFNIPASYLKAGTNLIAVQVAANSSTANVSFDASLVAGGGGSAPAVIRPNATWTNRVFFDDFNNPTESAKKWFVYDNDTLASDDNGQLECLKASNVNLAAGTTEAGANSYLQITAKPEQSTCKGKTRAYTAGHVTTEGFFSAQYGRIEMRAKIPVQQGTSKGIWPAFWLRPDDHLNGEIDVVEALGSNGTDDLSQSIVRQTLHHDYTGSPSYTYNSRMPSGSMADGQWHTYSVEWTPTEIRFFVDNAMTWSVKSGDPNWNYYDAFVGRPFFIRINTAVGGKWPGNPDSSTVFPANYQIDYVAWYASPDTKVTPR